jgi:uncharacterized protein YjdB
LNVKKASVLTLGLALVALVVGACSSTGPGKADVITLVIRTQAMVKGDTAQVRALVIDSDSHPITSPTLSWSTNHPDVATVDDKGLVKAVAAGTAIITATSDGAKGTVGINVSETTTGQSGD